LVEAESKIKLAFAFLILDSCIVNSTFSSGSNSAVSRSNSISEL